MKPINLKIQGINSYVTEQEVQFDKLSEANVFGIFGETGSGKTTILDAIVIALYGSSDREIIPNLINVNSKSAHIYFTFEVPDGESSKRYTVKREFKVRTSGVKTDAILTDEKDAVLAEQSDAVNDAILKLVGVGKKEFLKCIALPQGEFDRFLMDTPANRKKTIAKLFNLEAFGADLQEKIKHRKDMANLSHLNIQDKIAMYSEASEEQLKLLRDNLNENQHLLNFVSDRLSKSKANFEDMQNDYNLVNHQLVELNAKFGILKAEESDIKYLRKQVSYTEKYGKYILLYNAKIVLDSEIEQITDELKADRDIILNNTEQLNELDIQLGESTIELKQLADKMHGLSENIERYTLLKHTKDALEREISKMDAEIKDLQELISELKESQVEYRRLREQQLRQLDKMSKAVEENNNILDKLRDTKTLKTVESFLDYLSYLKNVVNPDSLQEVYQFDIYKEVNEMLSSITNYENSSRKEVLNLQNEHDALSRYNDDIEALEKNLQKANREYNSAIETIKINISEAQNTIVVASTKLEEKCETISLLKQSLRKKKDDLKMIVTELKRLPNLGNYDALISRSNELQEVVLTLEKRKTELEIEKNDTIVAIEVGTNHLQALKNNLSDIIKQMKSLKVSHDAKDNLFDTNLYLDDTTLIEAKEKLNQYDEEYKILTSKIEDIKKLIKNPQVDTDMMENARAEIRDLEAKERAYAVNVALSNQLISQMNDKLKDLEGLNAQKADIEKKLETIMELSNLTANGKLLDYVSEEYMQLITQFSNKFVYTISKGKYLLKYTGEFYVVDNFNGGISRSVKTLSGGERFIISLSLALGISQSIAISNNKRFNFFFIDEGFGSLSDDYIETVLSSFDALLKLRFTVGFISHVEKMQNFINNRIVVTKNNNEEGSIIKQYS